MIDKKAEQKECHQATMRTSYLYVIMSPHVRLQGISNSALRQGLVCAHVGSLVVKCHIMEMSDVERTNWVGGTWQLSTTFITSL